MDGSAGKEVKQEDDEEEMDTFTRPEKLDSSSSSSSSSSDDDEDDMPGEGGCDDGDDDQQMKKKAFMPGDEVAEGEELVMDEEAYVVYHQAHLGLPCLTFDILPGSPSRSDFGTADGGAAFEYPLTVYGVAGTQGPSVSNAILAFKMYNLYPIKRKSPKSGQGEDEEDDESDEEDDDSDEEDELRKKPKLSVAGIRHGSGCINRIRHLRLGNESTVAAAWSESGSVSIFSLDKVLAKLEGATAGTSVGSGGLRQEALDQACPLFSFSGHKAEGYSLDWSPTLPGVLASGDCNKDIYVWKPTEQATWTVAGKPLVGHRSSVEDIRWSPDEANVMASCSVDKSVRIWDTRAKPDKACMLTVDEAHDSDVNVIDWNAKEPFLVSGGDDGAVKVWDLRMLERGTPVAVFRHHKGPVTSVEWHHSDSTVLASSGADDQVALWDLAVEKDEEVKDEEDENLKGLPPQLLFIHQGLQDIKEIHWHRQLPGLLLSTSHSGFDVFRTISV